MAISKFTPENRGALIERISAGLTYDEAARAVDLGPATVQGWLRRKEPEYLAFAEQVKEARKRAKDRPEIMGEDELFQHVSEMVRKGSVAAAKLRWEMIVHRERKPDAEQATTAESPLEQIDQLAARRTEARAAA